MRVNKLRKALAGDKPIFGMGYYSQSLAIMEIIGHSGFDFVFIDCEHSPLGVDASLENVLRAADYAGLSTIVRVKSNDEHQIRNALEFGADADQAVRAGKFPPWGIRGAAGDVRSSHYAAGAFDWKQYVEVDPRYYRPAEVELLLGDASKAKRVLGWEPKVGFEELVRLMVDHDLMLAKREQAVTDREGPRSSVSTRWGAA